MSVNEQGQHQMIKTHLLKVHINCLGCQQKVKKLLRKIEGVYKVNINQEQELVTVSGTVDSDVLIEKLAGSGKHAELFLPDFKANLKQEEDGSKSYPGNDIQILHLADSMPSPFFEGNRTPGSSLNPNTGDRTVMGRRIEAVNWKEDLNPGVYTQRNGLSYAGSGGRQIDYQNLSTDGHLPPISFWAHPYEFSAPQAMHVYDHDPDKLMMNEGSGDYSSYLSWLYEMQT